MLKNVKKTVKLKYKYVYRIFEQECLIFDEIVNISQKLVENPCSLQSLADVKIKHLQAVTH